MSEHVIARGPELTSASLAAMYQETLLSHHRAPHNRRELPEATHAASRKNPLCGDALGVALMIDGECVVDAAFTGRGCSIAVASASMLTQVLPGLSKTKALALVDDVEAMLTSPAHSVKLPAALEALRGVAPFPGRHGCATMPWLALRDALREALRDTTSARP